MKEKMDLCACGGPHLTHPSHGKYGFHLYMKMAKAPDIVYIYQVGLPLVHDMVKTTDMCTIIIKKATHVREMEHFRDIIMVHITWGRLYTLGI